MFYRNGRNYVRNTFSTLTRFGVALYISITSADGRVQQIGLIQDANPDFKMQLKKAHLDDLTATQPSQTDSDDSKHEPRRPPSVDPTGLKTAHLEDITPIRTSQKYSDNSNYDLSRLPDIDPSAMLVAPISFATRTLASRSSITTKRDSILQAFESYRHITTPESRVAIVTHGKKK